MKRTKAMIVPSGLTQTEEETLGFTYFEIAQEAIEEVFPIKDREAKIIVLKHGGDIIPNQAM